MYFPIIVRELDGTEVEFHVDRTQCVGDLKRLIEVSYGKVVSKLLDAHGNPLNNNDKLKAHDVHQMVLVVFQTVVPVHAFIWDKYAYADGLIFAPLVVNAAATSAEINLEIKRQLNGHKRMHYVLFYVNKDVIKFKIDVDGDLVMKAKKKECLLC